MSTNDVALLALQMGERLGDENKRLRALNDELLGELVDARSRILIGVPRETQLLHIDAAIDKAKKGTP